jgi:ubiquinone/menaquinone biosynthesis C-methylase UbiE
MSTYDLIGENYNLTRKADPMIASIIWNLLDLPVGKMLLDVGCGRGNYTNALHNLGGTMFGIDPSTKMLQKAMNNQPSIKWRIGAVENTKFVEEFFDGATATLTIHHWDDHQRGFKSIYDGLKPGAPLVIFTSTSEQMKGYWLNAYFPEMLEKSMAQMPTKIHVANALLSLGYELVSETLYSIHPRLEDQFLYSGKHNPNLYLDAGFRSGISSFRLHCTEDELASGLSKLTADIKSGKVFEVINEYKNQGGDYLFIKAIKV